jgi:hypothetical protein
MGQGSPLPLRIPTMDRDRGAPFVDFVDSPDCEERPSGLQAGGYRSKGKAAEGLRPAAPIRQRSRFGGAGGRDRCE